MFPDLFSLPGLGQPVQSYGVMIAVGFVLASLYISRDARQAGEPRPSRFTDLAFYCLLVGMVGARLLFIAVNWRLYWAHPIELLYLWRGGLVFYGGFLAALAFAVVWCKRNGEPFFKVADRLIPAVALNHAWGRIGCLAAGCCFGAPTESALALHYPLGSPVHDLQIAQSLVSAWMPPLPVHASPIYEAIGELALFFVLAWFRRKKRFDGQLLLLWLALYPLLRSAVELTRGDVERGFLIPGIVSTSQAISVLVAGLSLILFMRLKKR